jgi:6-phosphofructokinase
MKRKKIGILTGGGDVPPLNAVISSAVKTAVQKDIDVIGFLHGWQGILTNNFVDLTDISIDPLVGGTILKSSRVNLNKVENARTKIEKVVAENNLTGLIVIGGEDTLSNSLILKNIPQVLISKTIDNDVGIVKENEIINHFTLGYPTAAEKISSFVSMNEGLRTTAYSHERIIVVESMGMHAGWLALSSSLGNPDFVIIPEFSIDYEKLKEKIIERYLKEKNVIIVIAEGTKWQNGNYLSADMNDKDSFGHPKFKGASETLTKMLKDDLKKYFDTKNVNSVNPSYLYRSGKPNALDLQSAQELGDKAVELISEGLTEPVFLLIQNSASRFVPRNYLVNDMSDIENFHRFVTESFYDKHEFKATERGLRYLTSICRKLPQLNYGLNNS